MKACLVVTADGWFAKISMRTLKYVRYFKIVRGKKRSPSYW